MTKPESKARVHDFQTHRAQIERILQAWGASAANATTIADVLAWADARGIDSHGISMLTSYDRQREHGQIKLHAEPRIVKQTPVSALIDADGGLGHPAAKFAMQTAIDKAKSAGVAVCVVRNTNHYGACGYYTLMAADAGLIGMTTTTTPGVTVAPSGGAQGRLGTDPWSLAAPGEPGRPFLLDMATATVASGRVRNKANEGQPLPAGWVMTKDGLPSHDPLDLIERGGFLTSLGGTPDGANHKGYGLAAMARILSAGLAGESLLIDPTSPGNARARRLGHFFLALDPGLFREREEFASAVKTFCDDLRATKPVDASKPVMVAGDPERRIEAERRRDGIPIGRGLLGKLREIASASGAAWLLS